MFFPMALIFNKKKKRYASSSHKYCDEQHAKNRYIGKIISRTISKYLQKRRSYYLYRRFNHRKNCN